MKQIKITTQIKEINTLNEVDTNFSISDYSTTILNPSFSQEGSINLDATTLLFNDVLKYFNPTFVLIYSDNYFYIKENVLPDQTIIRKTRTFSYNNDITPSIFGIANGTFDIDEVFTLSTTLTSIPIVVKYFIFGSPQSPYSSQYNYPPIVTP